MPVVLSAISLFLIMITSFSIYIQGKFHEAAKLYKKTGNEEKVRGNHDK